MTVLPVALVPEKEANPDTLGTTRLAPEPFVNVGEPEAVKAVEQVKLPLFCMLPETVTLGIANTPEIVFDAPLRA